MINLITMATEVPKELTQKGKRYARSVYHQAAAGGYELDQTDIEQAYLQGAFDALDYKEIEK